MRNKPNRDKKVDKRLKDRPVPATRSYLHAMTNSMAKRYAKKGKQWKSNQEPS